MHFLIIDDDAVARTVLKNHLTAIQPGCKITEAENGAQGIFKFFKIKPDIVFLDILMPFVDGRVFLDVLQECYRCGLQVKKPCIVLTSMLDSKQINQMHPLNGDMVASVIKKPVTRNKLKKIEELLPE